MKRFLITLLALLALSALTVGSAFALEANTPINDEVRLKLPSGELVPNRDYSFTTTGSLTTGSDVTFTIEGGTITSVALGTKRPWSAEDAAEVVYEANNKSQFTYHFMEPATYYIFVNGTYLNEFTISGDDLLNKRVKSIMSQCPETSDYKIALWAHDWLTLHTYYDTSTTYHGPDYLLNENYGWGVCQSYAIAYYMMLKSKGIDVEYVDSDEISHAWNAVCIDGNWYETDVTWDTIGKAPYGQGSPATYNHHMYFLLPDLIFRNLENAHVGQPEKYATKCVSMASNYYVRNGYAENWLNQTVESQLGLRLTDTTETVTVQVSSQGEYINQNQHFNIPQTICAAALAQVINGTKRTNVNGSVYVLSAYSDGSALTVTAVRQGFDYSGMTALELPSNLSAISKEAFVNTAAQVIVIPAGITNIASNAFDNCKNLKYIVNHSSLVIIPPNGVVVIAE